jgi:hypothetical protein
MKFDRRMFDTILKCMSVTSKQVKQIIKMVRQYEVIYGGGISSSDASIREECEDLIQALEGELGTENLTVVSEGTSARASKAPRVRTPHIPRPTGYHSSVGDLVSRKNAESGKPGKSTAFNEAALKTTTLNASTKKAETGAPGKSEAKGPVHSGVSAKPGSKIASAAGSSPKPVPKNSVPAVSPPSGSQRAAVTVAPKKRSGAGEIARGPEPKADGKPPDAKRKQYSAMHLFDAFRKNLLPRYGGFIVGVHFHKDDGYLVFEIIGYENLQDLHSDGNSLLFKSAGCKLFAIVEPAHYLHKSIEPVNRMKDHMVPYRFNELSKITTKAFQTIYVGLKPIFMPTSFTIVKPEGDDLMVLFYNVAEVYANIEDFIIILMREFSKISTSDSRKAAESIVRGIQNFRSWLDEP